MSQDNFLHKQTSNTLLIRALYHVTTNSSCSIETKLPKLSESVISFDNFVLNYSPKDQNSKIKGKI